MKFRPIISVKEARKLLGKSAKELTDDQIQEVINDLSQFAKTHLKKKSVKKSKNGLGL